jgi:hypothetical protein
MPFIDTEFDDAETEAPNPFSLSRTRTESKFKPMREGIKGRFI